MIEETDGPVVSVIIPVYNAEKYIKTCIESVLKQSYKNYQLIIVDDGSYDKSSNICDEYAAIEDRVRVIHQKNQGVSCARNKGIEEASGQFVTFIDADDRINDEYIETLVDRQSHNDADLVVCAHVWEKRFHRTTVQRYVDKVYEETEIPSVIDKIDMGPWSKLYRKCIIKDRKIRFDSSVKFGEDRLFLLEYMKYCRKIAVCSKVIYYYNLKNTNSAVRKYYSDFYLYMKKIYDKEIELHSTAGDPNRMDEHRRDFYFLWCLEHYIKNSPKNLIVNDIKNSVTSFYQGLDCYNESAHQKFDSYPELISKWKKEHKKEMITFKIKRVCTKIL